MANTSCWIGYCAQCGKPFRQSSKNLAHCSKRCRGLSERRPIRDRFFDKIVKDANGCWLWNGQRNRQGYGVISHPDLPRHNNKIRATHLSWFIHVGHWPDQWILHTCDNPSCVNPDHLFEGDALANNRDAMRKGRNSHGERSPMAKLSESDVRAIRSEVVAGSTQTATAHKYGVSLSCVNDIVHHRRWAHLD